MEELSRILTVFFFCTFFFVKVGVPMAFFMFKSSFIKVFVVSCAGGITGNIIFTNLSATLLKWMDAYKRRINKDHKRQVFTRSTRRFVRIKQRFGLTGIALITPLISQPIGAFFAEKFFKDKKKVIVYLSVSVMLWSLLLYFILLFFHDQLQSWGLI